MTFTLYDARDRRDMLDTMLGEPDEALIERAVVIDDALAAGPAYFAARYPQPEQSRAAYVAERDVIRTVLGSLDPGDD